MTLANHPISGLYFTMTGGPEVYIYLFFYYKLFIYFWEFHSHILACLCVIQNKNNMFVCVVAECRHNNYELCESNKNHLENTKGIRWWTEIQVLHRESLWCHVQSCYGDLWDTQQKLIGAYMQILIICIAWANNRISIIPERVTRTLFQIKTI